MGNQYKILNDLYKHTKELIRQENIAEAEINIAMLRRLADQTYEQSAYPEESEVLALIEKYLDLAERKFAIYIGEHITIDSYEKWKAGHDTEAIDEI